MIVHTTVIIAQHGYINNILIWGIFPVRSDIIIIITTHYGYMIRSLGKFQRLLRTRVKEWFAYLWMSGHTDRRLGTCTAPTELRVEILLRFSCCTEVIWNDHSAEREGDGWHPSVNLAGPVRILNFVSRSVHPSLGVIMYLENSGPLTSFSALIWRIMSFTPNMASFISQEINRTI